MKTCKAALILLALVAGAGCVDHIAPAGKALDAVVILEHRVMPSFPTLVIKGRVKNMGHVPSPKIKITALFCSMEGKIIPYPQASTIVPAIGQSQTRTFTIHVDMSELRKANRNKDPAREYKLVKELAGGGGE